MILPSGQFPLFADLVRGKKCVLIGALSFEERCCSLPTTVGSGNAQNKIVLFKIKDPVDGFPNYSHEIERRIETNRDLLNSRRIEFDEIPTDLLVSEDDLSDMLQIFKSNRSTLYILDVTSLPKRYFCYFLKHLIRREWCQDLLVTYTMVGPEGYSAQHLTASPMTCAPLPGFSSAWQIGGDTLVISLGFESLNVRSILDVYPKQRGPKILMSFPCSTAVIRRQWNMLRQIFSKGQISLLKEDIKSVATWDAEEVFITLKYWEKECDSLALAPFGTKPHSLGLALYAIQSGSGMYYTQPKSYNPDYSKGTGESWGYLVKYEGIPCFDRPRHRL